MVSPDEQNSRFIIGGEISFEVASVYCSWSAVLGKSAAEHCGQLVLRRVQEAIVLYAKHMPDLVGCDSPEINLIACWNTIPRVPSFAAVKSDGVWITGDRAEMRPCEGVSTITVDIGQSNLQCTLAIALSCEHFCSCLPGQDRILES